MILNPEFTFTDEQQDIIDTIMRLPTGECLYVDGEAGVGKSFCIEEACRKLGNVLKCAPSGIAATNIGGRTFHKTFQLHGGMFLDKDNWGQRRSKLVKEYGWKQTGAMMQRMLCEHRIDILNTANAIWVDEAPMVRCDLLDEADIRLRHIMKKPHTPFGGKRIIFSGDLGQLQPVVPAEDAIKLTKAGYGAPYGFQQARVFSEK